MSATLQTCWGGQGSSSTGVPAALGGCGTRTQQHWGLWDTNPATLGASGWAWSGHPSLAPVPPPWGLERALIPLELGEPAQRLITAAGLITAGLITAGHCCGWAGAGLDVPVCPRSQDHAQAQQSALLYSPGSHLLKQGPGPVALPFSVV